MASNELTAWFTRHQGRSPEDRMEAMRLYVAETIRINPRIRRRAEEVKKYATSQGGVTLQYAKAKYPDYWGEGLPRTNDQACTLIGISEERGIDIHENILANVMPILVQSPEWREQPSSADLKQVDLSQ